MSSTIMSAWVGQDTSNAVRDTWGHTFPKKRKKYPGKMFVFVTAFGEYGVLNLKFDGMDENPALCDSLDRFIDRFSDKEPGVYEWHGEFMQYKNGSCWFSQGRIRRAFCGVPR